MDEHERLRLKAGDAFIFASPWLAGSALSKRLNLPQRRPPVRLHLAPFQEQRLAMLFPNGRACVLLIIALGSG
ncbi:MAG: hypothetical protein ACRD9W_26830, partial [Terriglobia bacterium]